MTCTSTDQEFIMAPWVAFHGLCFNMRSVITGFSSHIYNITDDDSRGGLLALKIFFLSLNLSERLKICMNLLVSINNFFYISVIISNLVNKEKQDYILFIKKWFQYFVLLLSLKKYVSIIYTYNKNCHKSIENLQKLRYFYEKNDLYIKCHYIFSNNV